MNQLDKEACNKKQKKCERVSLEITHTTTSFSIEKFEILTNKSHNHKPYPGSTSNLRKLLTIGLGALLHQMDGILGELTEGLDEDFVEAFFF